MSTESNAPDAAEEPTEEDLHGAVSEATHPVSPPTEQSGFTTDFEEAGVVDYDPIAERRKIRREKRKLLFGSPAFVTGLIIVGFWTLCAIVPGLITSTSPNVSLQVGARKPPQADAWLGTNTIGNDVFARLIHGARPVLILAPIAAILATVLGTLLGLLMGYLRGWVDEVFGRVIEAFLSLPVILLALLVLTMFGQTDTVVILTIAILFTPIVTRTIRSAVMAEAQLDYVTAAKLRGENSFYIMANEIFPNITAVAVVEFTVRVGYAIFTVATLAFLGLGGADATVANWGRDVAEQKEGISGGYVWAPIFPALAIASLVIGVNLIADSLDRVSKS